MKQVERVSLGGYAFTLDDDAARLIENYLSSLEKHYKDREGGRDILDGIEERMAELLLERCGRDGVVNIDAARSITSTLGRPEDIEAADAEAEETGSADGPADGRRKLYRDLSDKVVAGVCSGLGAYFNVDNVLFRIIFVAGTLGMCFIPWRGHFSIHLLFPVLYAALWVCMPAAKTVRQRWEQRGEDGTLSSLQRNIEKGAREVDKAVNAVGNSRVGSEFSRLVERFIGVILLILAFAGLFAGGVFSVGTGFLRGSHGTGLHNYGFLGLGRLYGRGMAELYENAPVLADVLSQPGMHLLLALVVFLPFLGILYGALQLLFGFKAPSWHPGLVIFVLWLLSIVALGILIATGCLSAGMFTI